MVIWTVYSVLAYICYTVGFVWYLRHVDGARWFARASPIAIVPFVSVSPIGVIGLTFQDILCSYAELDVL